MRRRGSCCWRIMTVIVIGQGWLRVCMLRRGWGLLSLMFQRRRVRERRRGRGKKRRRIRQQRRRPPARLHLSLLRNQRRPLQPPLRPHCQNSRWHPRPQPRPQPRPKVRLCSPSSPANPLPPHPNPIPAKKAFLVLPKTENGTRPPRPWARRMPTSAALLNLGWGLGWERRVRGLWGLWGRVSRWKGLRPGVGQRGRRRGRRRWSGCSVL